MKEIKINNSSDPLISISIVGEYEEIPGFIDIALVCSCTHHGAGFLAKNIRRLFRCSLCKRIIHVSWNGRTITVKNSHMVQATFDRKMKEEMAGEVNVN